MHNRLNHLVVTVHGIRTFGHWQPRFAAILQEKEPDLAVFNYVFGYFSIVAFLIPPLRWLVTRRFRQELLRLCGKHPQARIDLVGHSFGTHLIAWGVAGISADLRPRFHTVILAGSVLRSDFNWGVLIEEGTVQRIINDCGTKDIVLWLSQFFVLFTGMAGRLGFAGMMGKNLENRFFAGGHSLYFESFGLADDNFMKHYWVPLILGNAPIETIDERTIPTWYEGVVTTVLQNFELVKLIIYTFVLLTPAITFGLLYHEANLERQRADEETRLAVMEAGRADRVRDEALATLLWVFNRSAFMSYDSFYFDDKTLPLMQGIFKRLLVSGYDGGGVIELVGHVGEFATIKRPDGTSVLATKENIKNVRPGDVTYGMTSEYGLALGQKAAESARQVASILGTPENDMEAMSEGRERPLVPYPKSWRKDPDAWNIAAALNNRIEIRLCKRQMTSHSTDATVCIVDPVFRR